MNLSRIAIVLVSLLAFKANALVDMNNAGYTNSWVDLEVPGNGYDMRVLRAYKSRTIYNGMFGFGWCSEFETKLELTSEGSAKISECGDGQETIFSTAALSKADVDNTIKKIVAKMKTDSRYKTSSAQFWTNLQQQLFEDGTLRTDYAKQYGLITPIKEGEKLIANGKEVETLVLSKGVYTRTMADGSYQRYDKEGRMTHMFDKNGNFLKFEYQNGLLTQLEDNNARKLNFKYFPNKKVQKITGPSGLVSEYKYNQQEDLIWNRNAWAKKESDAYTFEYNEFHNLTKATWPDKTFIAIKYDNVKDWVTSFTDREKCVESYKYEFSPSNPKYNYWSTATKVCGKETVAKNRYEFWHKQLPNGEVVLSRVQTNNNGTIRDVTYHDTLGKPVTIKVNSERSDFEYYPNGLVKSKSAGNLKLDYDYDKTTNKVSVVKANITNAKGKVVSTKGTQFKYDAKGNLVSAQNTDGQQVVMTYDGKGRIQTITDQAKKVVQIEYEERFGKPAVVTRPGLGTIKLSYKPNGEINKIDSKDGKAVASQIASAFNNLLDVIAPATQELYL